MLVVPSDPTSVSLPPLSLSRLRPADNSDRSQPSAECASASMYKPACAVTGPDGGSFGGPVRRLAVGREDVREREGSSWVDSTEFLWGDRPEQDHSSQSAGRGARLYGAPRTSSGRNRVNAPHRSISQRRALGNSTSHPHAARLYTCLARADSQARPAHLET